MKIKRIVLSALFAAVCAVHAAFSEPQSDGMPPVPPGFGDGFGTVPDETAPDLKAKLVVGKKEAEKTISGGLLVSDKADTSVLLVTGGADVKAQKVSFEKKGGDVTNGGQSNFYGLNAAIVTQQDSSLLLQDVTVTTDAEGANAVFATGKDAAVTIKGIKIRTHANSSRGLDATYGGVITADKVDVATQGAHCAAFATDRGEGTVTVNGGTAYTAGEGSPVIYSTGAITVRNLTGRATGSEIAVIEGKNSITIEKSKLTGGTSAVDKKDVQAAVMLYQSMSGDANRGTSVFTATDSVLTSTARGAFFYITNTEARINLSRTKLVDGGDVLLLASGNNSPRGWGRAGANGGTVTLSAQQQVLTGNIAVDAISSVSLDFAAGTKFTGALNAANGGVLNLTLAKKAQLVLTADSYCNELVLEDTDFKNIKSNGHTLFYNKAAKANQYLHSRTILLEDGGKLVGIDMQHGAAAKSASNAATLPQDGGNSPKRPSIDSMGLKSFTGVIGVSETAVTLTVTTSASGAAAGTVVYTLAEMKAPSEMPQKPKSGEVPLPPDGSKMGGAGERALPPGAPGEKMQGGQQRVEMKKPVLLDELKALQGKTVTIQGAVMQEGVLTVFRVQQ